jgi:hypothetical protein
MRSLFVCAVALTALMQASHAHAQARTPAIVMPRILTPDTPRFQLESRPAFCIRVKKKNLKRTQIASAERTPCRTE